MKKRSKKLLRCGTAIVGRLSPKVQKFFGSFFQKRTCFLPLALLLCAATPTVETIVLVRHGEKPLLGLGQLSCQGLNRAMALGGVLKKDFGTPTAIFAPDPAVQKEDVGRKYDYVRPLATIEPAAISYGLPVDASIGVMDVAALAKALDAPALQGALVFVAWEHKQLVAVTRLLVKEHGGHAADVPDWGHEDFDGIYVLRVTRDGATTSVSFTTTREHLDGLSPRCGAGSS